MTEPMTEALTQPIEDAVDDIDAVTCPVCGTRGTVTLNRRLASDFCKVCDYPLFWTPSIVLRNALNSAGEESLRRLPGTVGRASTASLTCPHCAEPNPMSGIDCVRCGLPLHVVAAPPPVVEESPFFAVPPLEFAPEPEPSRWWAWVLFGLTIVGVIVLIVLLATGTLK